MAKQYGIAVDISSCIGCGLCVMACKQEHNLPPNVDDVPGTDGRAWNQVLELLQGIYPDLSGYYLYLQCMHCENLPCRDACPIEGAIYKREDGLVLFDRQKCNGCRDKPEGPRCIPACPYGVIQFNDKETVAEACALCVHLIDAGLEPACVRACPGGTLIFGDLNDRNSKASQALRAAGDRVFVLKPERGTNPSVRYIRPRRVSLDRVSNIDKAKWLYGFKKPKVKPL